MNRQEWHSLAAFGTLVIALGLFNPKMALYTVGVAAAVVSVRNSDKITGFLNGEGSAKTNPGW